jgi:hypothetical protein
MEWMHIQFTHSFANILGELKDHRNQLADSRQERWNQTFGRQSRFDLLVFEDLGQMNGQRGRKIWLALEKKEILREIIMINYFVSFKSEYWIYKHHGN